MFFPEDWSIPDYIYFRLPFASRGNERSEWPSRLGREAEVPLDKELETRRFLAEVVYRIPEDLLDDVIRVRVDELVEKRRR